MNKLSYILITIGLLTSAACHEGENTDHSDHNQGMADSPAMHHHNMEGMDHEQIDHSNMIVLTQRQQFLAGITTDSARTSAFSDYLTIIGVVATDENSTSVISSRLNGRITHLHLRTNGENVKAGDPILEMYSETMYAEQNEFIRLLTQNADASLLSAARGKLVLHGLSDAQINKIEQSRVASPEFTVYSNAGGFVESVNVREGDFVNAGAILCQVSRLDMVRINAQLYPDEAAMLNDSTQFIIDDGTQRSAEIIFNNPSVAQNTKTYTVYLRVNNPDHDLKPGMLVNVRMESNRKKCLAIPKQSVLMESGMYFTWVLEPDGMFNRRMIQIGAESGDRIEVVSGLKEGEVIVEGGVYLLNSEFILRKGSHSMAGMEM